MSLYHIPMYRLFELAGLKNPNSKLPPADTKVLPPSLTDALGLMVMVSCILVEEVLRMEKRNAEKTKLIGRISIRN